MDLVIVVLAWELHDAASDWNIRWGHASAREDHFAEFKADPGVVDGRWYESCN